MFSTNYLLNTYVADLKWMCALDTLKWADPATLKRRGASWDSSEKLGARTLFAIFCQFCT